MKYIIIILSLGLLCASWILVQLLARKMKTKNHFDDLNSSCGNCNCGAISGSCENEMKKV